MVRCLRFSFNFYFLKYSAVVLVVASLLLGHAYAQKKTLPKGLFSTDTLKIGEHIRYSLSFSHPKQMELVFPDKNFNYFPFELVRKEYYPTRTKSDTSVDSVVYVLRTFEINDAVNYRLPVFVLDAQGDSTLLWPDTESLTILQLTRNWNETTRLKESVKFIPVAKKVNYLYYTFISGIIIIVTLLVFLFFRKNIVKRYKLYTIRKGHSTFTKNFEKLQQDFSRTRELSMMENTLSLWKVYLTRLENLPINTYTTTEIITLFRNEALADGLRVMDRSIYGGLISGEPEKAFAILRKFCDQRYLLSKRKIING